MKKFIILLFILSPCFIYSQKTKINTLDGGFIVKEKEEFTSGVNISKKNNDSYTLIAVKNGYATQLFNTDSILALNQSEYTVKLNPISSLDYTKVRNKFSVAGFLDKQNKIKAIPYYNGYSYVYKSVNLTTYEYKSAIYSKLIQNKFKVIDENETFKNKSNNADYALGGEIIDYSIDTRGTPGFRTLVVVKWAVYDVANEETIYTTTTAGYSNTGTKIKVMEALKLALEDALGGIIIDPKIKEIAYKNDDDNNNVAKDVTIIPSIKSDQSNENMIQNAIESSITIKTNSGHGSGFLISSSGYILTNYHVIEDSTELQGIFQNGLTLPLKIVSFDKKTDVALCKILGKGYKPMPLDTTSIKNKIGSDVIAIGTPENIDLGQTVTKGIVSGLREFNSNLYIQTDVTINSGNSGGMLINKNGSVIGIVAAKIKGNGIEGLGFAIPINKALKALNIKIQ